MFDALGKFLKQGHRLVILLGNHDIELALPPVRRRLEQLIGIGGHHDYLFIYDGEAYVVGDALIEHGNRYDQFNVVDYDALRRLRSLMSRQQEIPRKYWFPPPAGSDMVASVINPIKQDYKFIDLLKPEDGAVVPLLLALEPGCRRFITQAAKLALRSRKHATEAPGLPRWGGDIASETPDAAEVVGADMAAVADWPAGTSGSEDERALKQVLNEALENRGDTFLVEVESLLPAQQIGSDIAATDQIDRAFGLARLLFAKNAVHETDDDVKRRLPALRTALHALQGAEPMGTDVEVPRYFDAAQALAVGRIRHVVFGHTHKPKHVPLDSGGSYLNSGTWADVLHFPHEILSGSDVEIESKLWEFVKMMQSNEFSKWTLFHPTYVFLELDDQGEVGTCELRTSQG